MKKKQKDKMINLILVIIAIVIFIINIVLFLKGSTNETETELIENDISSEENYNNNFESVNVKEMDESDRMMFYINEFLDKLEGKDYKTAYSYLNNDFKNNYFKSEEEFKNYVENNLNIATIAMEFSNIERLGNPINGNIYVVFVNLIDYQKDTKKETKFVILEKDYDDFELSFSLN